MSDERPGPSRMHRVSWTVVGAIVMLVIGGGIGWSVFTVLTPAEDVLDSTSFTYVSVESGEVSSTIQLNTVATWAPALVAANRASGVVTGVNLASGDEVRQGEILYTVDMRPVVVAEGEVPAFRALGKDAEGSDVRQLQELLSSLGFYAGPIDGKAGAGTVRAITEWQKSAGLADTGIVEMGDVIYVPSLPARLVLDQELIFRGASLSGGEEAVLALPPAPDFVVPVTEPQAAMMPPGTRVVMDSPDGATEWIGFTDEQTSDPDTGAIVVALEGREGSTICGEECAQVPTTSNVTMRSQIVAVEPVSGLVVPSAALVTSADGQTSVVDDDGIRIPVSVVAAARGMSIVEGVAQGTRVRVPGGES